MLRQFSGNSRTRTRPKAAGQLSGQQRFNAAETAGLDWLAICPPIPPLALCRGNRRDRMNRVVARACDNPKSVENFESVHNHSAFAVIDRE